MRFTETLGQHLITWYWNNLKAFGFDLRDRSHQNLAAGTKAGEDFCIRQWRIDAVQPKDGYSLLAPPQLESRSADFPDAPDHVVAFMSLLRAHYSLVQCAFSVNWISFFSPDRSSRITLSVIVSSRSI